jgi:hypothetical protein
VKRVLFALLILTAATTPLSAAQQSIFDRYEAVRQGLLSGDLEKINSAARELANSARLTALDGLAAHASQLVKVANIKDARLTFAVVSQDLISYRKTVSGEKPVVLYCTMEKKSWLQPTASPITNPYLDASMRSCGEVVK